MGKPLNKKLRGTLRERLPGEDERSYEKYRAKFDKKVSKHRKWEKDSGNVDKSDSGNNVETTPSTNGVKGPKAQFKSRVKSRQSLLSKKDDEEEKKRQLLNQKRKEQGLPPLNSQHMIEKAKQALLPHHGSVTKKMQKRIEFQCHKKNFILNEQLKQKLEKIKARSVSSDVRNESIQEMVSLSKGHILELVRKHDASRVFQYIQKFGTFEIRKAIYTELKDDVVELSKSLYAFYMIRNFAKYSLPPAEKAHFLDTLLKNSNVLLPHRVSGRLIELCYIHDPRWGQKLMFWVSGPEMKALITTFEKNSKMKTLPDVEQILGYEPIFNPRKIQMDFQEVNLALVDKRMYSVSRKLMNKGLPLIRWNVVHRILLIALRTCSGKAVSEIIEEVNDTLIEMMHTKAGSQFSVRCISYMTAKQRKVLIKSMDTFVPKVGTDPFGHLVMMKMLTSIDDTKLLKNKIVEPLIADIESLVFNQYGRCCLLILFTSAEDTQLFNFLFESSNAYIRFLLFEDNLSAIPMSRTQDENGPKLTPSSKKDAEKRRSELLEAVLPTVRDFFLSEADLEKVLTDPLSNRVFVGYFMADSDVESKQSILDEICTLVSNAEPGVENILNSYFSSRALQYLIANAKEPNFAGALYKAINAKHLESFACERGSDYLLATLASNDKEAFAKLKSVLSKSKKFSDCVTNDAFAGARRLSEIFGLSSPKTNKRVKTS